MFIHIYGGSLEQYKSQYRKLEAGFLQKPFRITDTDDLASEHNIKGTDGSLIGSETGKFLAIVFGPRMPQNLNVVATFWMFVQLGEF